MCAGPDHGIPEVGWYEVVVGAFLQTVGQPGWVGEAAVLAQGVLNGLREAGDHLSG